MEENFLELLESLNNPDEPLRAALVYRLSDITPEDLTTLSNTWLQISVEQRRKLMHHLLETSETTFEVDYAAVARLGLDDPDSIVRKAAIRTLWTDTSPSVMRLLIKHMESDEDLDVRVAAAEGLGVFVLKGSLGEFTLQKAQQAEDALYKQHSQTENIELKRRTLESLAYSEDEKVVTLISEALGHPNVKMQASALCAMGRNADERWISDILIALGDEEPEIRYEAARASGELMLKGAVSELIELAQENDFEVQSMAIWALGEIGGDEAQATLERLSEAEEDPELSEIIEDALNMALLINGKLSGALGLDEDFDPDDL